ncbi:hypothetical protein Pcinc_007803 [Petrolisthes cinctipes]|uniref:Uncharacterized protein n=1 Tax=Petrolisthes cinctipes TaxID=88211 RepID=A0AAE1GAD3_PETCI|nr:hypothetical protein Pcinc_007803 [Petrolisthes cinctipes]
MINSAWYTLRLEGRMINIQCGPRRLSVPLVNWGTLGVQTEVEGEGDELMGYFVGGMVGGMSNSFEKKVNVVTPLAWTGVARGASPLCLEEREPVPFIYKSGVTDH